MEVVSNPDEAPAGAIDLADGKAPDALRTIGEVARALGIRQHVLRYWEDQFPLLRPLKRSGGRRYYRPGDVELVRTIDRLVHQEGYTLRGARQVLEAAAPRRSRTRRAEPPTAETVAMEPIPAPAAEPPVAAPAEAAPQPVLNGLRQLRDKLAAALAAA